MRLIERLRARVRRDDTGLTLIELLVASSIMVIVITSLTVTLRTGVSKQAKVSASIDAQATLRRGFTVLEPDIRGAVRVDPTSTASKLILQTVPRGATSTTPVPVVYTVSADSRPGFSGTYRLDRCLPAVSDPTCTAGGPKVLVASRLVDASGSGLPAIFTFNDPQTISIVTVTLSSTPQGAAVPTSVSTSVRLRNG